MQNVCYGNLAKYMPGDETRENPTDPIGYFAEDANIKAGGFVFPGTNPEAQVKGLDANATSIADLENAKIVAQAGTFHDEVVDQIPNVQHQTALEDFNTMQVALNAGTIHGYIAEEPGAIADCDKYSNFTYIHLENNKNGFAIADLTNITLAVGVKKGSSLLVKINEVIDSITVDERNLLMEEARNQAKEQNL